MKTAPSETRSIELWSYLMALACWGATTLFAIGLRAAVSTAFE